MLYAGVVDPLKAAVEGTDDNILHRKNTLTCNFATCTLLKIQCTPGNLLHRKTLTCSNFVLFAICTLLKIHSGSGNISAKLMSYTKIL